MKAEQIRRVLIAGAGTMGKQIGLHCALNGFSVVYYDLREDILAKALDEARAKIESKASSGKISREQADRALNGISVSADLAAAAAGVDIVSESVPEDPKIKGEFFARLNEICPPTAIFTTNTSTLVPSMFADKTGRPDRFLAFHFHPGSKLVDVMPHPGTSPETVETVRRFAEMINHSPVVLKKENPGYVFNALLSPWMLAGLTLASKDVASVEDIDRSWREVTGMAVGPFTVMDLVGLDTVWKITDYWAKARNDKNAQKCADLLKTFVERGELGMKTGKGFYDYSGKK